MVMSQEAAAGMRAAVTWNPVAARQLFYMLRDLPIGVRHKPQDRYGPLSLLLHAMPPVRQITRTESVPITPPPLSQEDLKRCEIFNEEWLQRRFTKQELASAIESILSEVDPRPLLEEPPADTHLMFNAKGTFLQHGDDDENNQAGRSE